MYAPLLSVPHSHLDPAEDSSTSPNNESPTPPRVEEQDKDSTGSSTDSATSDHTAESETITPSGPSSSNVLKEDEPLTSQEILIIMQGCYLALPETLSQISSYVFCAS